MKPVLVALSSGIFFPPPNDFLVTEKAHESPATSTIKGVSDDHTLS
jgi:hypothetical protein